MAVLLNQSNPRTRSLRAWIIDSSNGDGVGGGSSLLCEAINNTFEEKDLKKYFPIKKGIIISKEVGAVKAVDGVSFTIKKGETLGLV